MWVKLQYLSPGPGRLAHYKRVDNTFVTDSVSKSPAQCSGLLHSCRAAGLQESRGWRGSSAKDRGWDGCRAERPRGRDQLAACRLALSGWDSSDWPATVRMKSSISPFTPRSSHCHFFLCNSWGSIPGQIPLKPKSVKGRNKVGETSPFCYKQSTFTLPCLSWPGCKEETPPSLSRSREAFALQPVRSPIDMEMD